MNFHMNILMNITFTLTLTLSPVKHQILLLQWGPQRPPLRYQGRIHVWPHVSIEHLILGIFRDDMQKFGPVSNNLTRFQDFKILWKCDWWTKIVITLLILKIEGSNVACKPNDSRKNHIFAYRLKDHCIDYILF